MTTVDLAAALTAEHHQIDAGIEKFLAGEPDSTGRRNLAPLVSAFEALRRHIHLEEEYLFGPIREAGMVMPIMVMVREHAALWTLMDGITDAYEGRGPERDSQWMTEACAELLSMLDDHNAKEEPIIYPRTGIDLDEQQQQEFARLLEVGTLPEDWLPQGLG